MSNDEDPTVPGRPSRIRTPGLRDEGDDVVSLEDAFIVDALTKLGTAIEGSLRAVRETVALVRAGRGNPAVFEDLAEQFEDHSNVAAGAARALRRIE